MPVKTTVTPTDIILAQLKNELLGEFATVHEELNSLQDTQAPAKPNLPNSQTSQQGKKTPAQLQQERLYEKRRVDTYKQLNKLFEELTAGLKKNNVELIKFYKYIKQNNLTLTNLADAQQQSNLALDGFLEKLKAENDLGEENKLDSDKIGKALAKSFSDKLKSAKSKESDKSAKTLDKIEQNTAKNQGKTKVEVVKEAEAAPEGMEAVIEDFSILSKALLGITTKQSEAAKKKQPEKKEVEEKELTNFQKFTKISKVLLGVPERKKEYDAASPVSNIGLIVDGIKNVISPKKKEEEKAEKTPEELQKSTYDLLQAQFLELQKIQLTLQNQLLFEKIQAADVAENAEAIESDKLAYQKLFLDRMEALTTINTKKDTINKQEISTKTNLLSKLVKLLGGLLLGDALIHLKSIFGYLTKIPALAPIIKALTKFPTLSTLLHSLTKLGALIPSLTIAGTILAGIAGTIAMAAATKQVGKMWEAKQLEDLSETELKVRAQKEARTFTSKMRELGKNEYEIAEIENIKDEVQRKNKARTELTKTYLQQLREKYDVDQTKLEELSKITDSQEQLRKVKQLFEEKQKAKLEQSSKIQAVNQPEPAKIEVQPIQVQQEETPKIEYLEQPEPAKIENIPYKSEKVLPRDKSSIEDQPNKSDENMKTFIERNDTNAKVMQAYMKEMIIAQRESKSTLRTEYIIPQQNVPSILLPALSM